MRALRHPSPEFPVGVTPAQAIAFALSICGIKVSESAGTVRFVLYALARCGFKIELINNVIPFKGEDHGARSRG
jgi:hypothetical protein